MRKKFYTGTSWAQAHPEKYQKDLSEKEGGAPSPYCKVNSGEFQTWVSDFPDIERGEGGGPYPFLCAPLLGDTTPITQVVTSQVSPKLCKVFCVSCVLNFLDLQVFILIVFTLCSKTSARRRLQQGKPKITPKCIYDTSSVLFGSTKWTDPLATVLLNYFTAFEKSHPSHKSTSWQRSYCQAACTKQKSRQISIIVTAQKQLIWL